MRISSLEDARKPSSTFPFIYPDRIDKDVYQEIFRADPEDYQGIGAGSWEE